MSKAQVALTAQMLQWISSGDHSYGEVLDVWKTSCPRLSVWEDACMDGLVDCTSGRTGIVYLTEKGRRFMTEHALC